MREFIKRNAIAIFLPISFLIALCSSGVIVTLVSQQTTQPPPLEVSPLGIPGRDLSADLMLDIAKGNVEGHSALNKFGRCTNLDSGIDTDCWDGANATTDIDTITLPTVARTHVITSTDSDDTAAGTGMQTMAFCGLPDWDTAQVCETLTLLGSFSVTTTNSYVAVNRMRGVTSGTSGPNAGIIAARALTDGTVSAQINAGAGQTQMAHYCLPSIQTFYMIKYYASFLKGGGAPITVNITLLVNPEPDSEPSNWLTKHTQAVISSGTSLFSHLFDPYFKITGPACAKMQGNSSAADIDGSAGFGGILVDN